jgi:hypothetical protein
LPTLPASLTLAVVACALVCATPAVARGETEDERTTDWNYGGFVDLSYPVNFNFPENHQFRTRTTTPRTNELAPNMVLGYVRKDISTTSPWGMEFGIQGGYDSKDFAFGQDQPHVGGADTLRHFSRANVSYLAPIGNGLTLTAGLFNSFIGYESLYSRDNFNYSRSWIADNSPYTMFGAAAQYPVSEALTLGLYVINGYWHLAHPNDLPSYGTQVIWNPSPRLTFKENLYYGPDQSDTDVQFWRLFSDSIIEWREDDVTIALSYDIGTEEIAGRPGNPRTFWTGAALFTRWHVQGPWSVALRPEFYWDRNGRQTGFEQLVKSATTTIEYKLSVARFTGLMRLEYRWDESTGAGGGFFTGGEIAPGIIGLTPSQQILFLSLIWSFDS